MKLDRDQFAGNLIRSFSDGAIRVGTETYAHPVIITPEQIITDWKPAEAAQLSLADLQVALSLEPEVILVGTGTRQCFPAQAVIADVLRRGIGIEIMNTAAACRTFNVLASEMRRVVAALWVA
jgi:uncharacterized protein